MYTIAFVGTLIESISDIILKEYVTNKKTLYLLLGLDRIFTNWIYFYAIIKI